MSMDFNRPTGGLNGTEPSGSLETGGSLTDAPLMNATPIWETRGKKKRGFGRSSSAAAAAPVETRTFDTPAETRTFETEAPITEAPMATAAVMPNTYGGPAIEPDPVLTSTPIYTEERIRTDAADDAGFAAPIGRTTTARKTRNDMAPAGVALGVLALAGLGAAGWYATHRDSGVPEIAAGQPETASTTDVAANTAVAPPATLNATASSDQARAAPRAAEPPRTVRVARTRPAAASASSEGVNASATLPSGPQPYSGAAATPTAPPTAAAPAPVNPEAAPAPAPTQAAPAETPAPDVAPQTSETPPADTATPTPQ